MIDSLAAVAANWRNFSSDHDQLVAAFAAAVNEVPALRDHRDWIEAHDFGYGHRSFHWVWHLLASDLPSGFWFLELGVHRGQSLSAVELAAYRLGKKCNPVGLGPLDGTGGFYEFRDYAPDVRSLFERFNGNRQPVLIRGLSTDPAALAQAAAYSPYDVVYIDSQHDTATTTNDLDHFAPMVRRGGYLIADDAGCNLPLPAHHFPGFRECSDVVDSRLPPLTANADWDHLFNVMHLRVWKRN